MDQWAAQLQKTAAGAHCAAATCSPAPGFIRADLPREYVTQLLTDTLTDLEDTSRVMRFNQNHNQWDLLIANLNKLLDNETVIRNCVEALAQENNGDEARRR